MDMDKFKRVLARFSEHLREAGEVKASEAVKTIIKYVDGVTKKE